MKRGGARQSDTRLSHISSLTLSDSEGPPLSRLCSIFVRGSASALRLPLRAAANSARACPCMLLRSFILPALLSVRRFNGSEHYFSFTLSCSHLSDSSALFSLRILPLSNRRAFRLPSMRAIYARDRFAACSQAIQLSSRFRGICKQLSLDEQIVNVMRNGADV